MEWINEATPFGVPLLVVYRTVAGEPKGRVVINLRGLKRVTVPDNYPLPLQSGIIASMRGKTFITVINAASFFYQFRVYPPHRDRFTVISPRSLKRSTVALMGFRNSPAYTQRYMNRLLKKHPYCRAFIDDIVIYSDTKEDHIEHLSTIFSLFKSKNLSIALNKSFIGYLSVELLDFRVNGLGLTTTTERVAAFRDLAFPSTLKALEQYSGMSGFIRHLTPYYSQLMEPLQQREVNLLAEGREGRQGSNRKSRQAQELLPEDKVRADPAGETCIRIRPGRNMQGEPDNTASPRSSKRLFLQIDGSLERGFGVMLFHFKDGYEWEPGSTIPLHECSL